MKYVITHQELEYRCQALARKIAFTHLAGSHDAVLKVYPVPRGGVPVAYMLKCYLPKMVIVDDVKEASIIIDDLVDSGRTRERYLATGLPFYTLLDKKVQGGDWVVFPWEGDAAGSIEDNVVRILQYIGEDPNRKGIQETPKRVVKSWAELFSGYKKDVKEVFKTFDEGYNELVLMQDIELYSTCEHHMLPFTGRAHVAYIASGKVIGASKLARILEIYSRRLQVQERLGVQVVEALMRHLEPAGAACIIEAKHHCMCSRGVGKQHSIMKTSAMRGRFLEDSAAGRAARAELMSLLK